MCLLVPGFVATSHSLRGVVLDRSSNLGDSRREPPFSGPKKNRCALLLSQLFDLSPEADASS